MTGRSLSKVSSAASELRALPNINGTFSTLQLEVTSPASIASAVSSVTDSYGRLDALINNAGIVSTSKDTLTSFRDTFETNVYGPVLISEAFRPLLLKSSNAYSLFITSGLGSLGLASDPNSPHSAYQGTSYRASKAALNMVAVEEMKVCKGQVKVFTCCPGLVTSNLRGTSEAARSAGGNAEDPETSGRMVLDVLEGMRDGDVGGFVQRGGVYPW